MKGSIISSVGHVAIRTPNVDVCVEHAKNVMGLTESARDESGVYLTEGPHHHSLRYLSDQRGAVDHIGLEATDDDALFELRKRLDTQNVRVLEGPHDTVVADSVRFVGPEDFVFEVYVGMPLDLSTERQTTLYARQGVVGVRPTRFGHLTLRVQDTGKMRDFLREILDFRISDAVAGGFFLRCNVDHHGLGVLPGRGELHHHAWEVQSIADLARIGDRLNELGSRLLWGPVRHGVGNNIAAYFPDPAGVVVEYYTDMQRIYVDTDDELREWGDDWYSMWALGRPENFSDYGLPPALGLTSAARLATRP